MTFPAGHQMLASEVSGLSNPVRIGLSARRVAPQSVASGGTGTGLLWDTIESGNNPSFLTVTSDTVTIPVGYPGIYTASFSAIATTLTGRAFVQFAVTSTICTVLTPRSFMDTANEDMAAMSMSFPLAVGDTVKMQVYHLTGSAQNFTGWMSFFRTSL
jgi:hypothetical protein